MLGHQHASVPYIFYLVIYSCFWISPLPEMGWINTTNLWSLRHYKSFESYIEPSKGSNNIGWYSYGLII